MTTGVPKPTSAQCLAIGRIFSLRVPLLHSSMSSSGSSGLRNPMLHRLERVHSRDRQDHAPIPFARRIFAGYRERGQAAA